MCRDIAGLVVGMQDEVQAGQFGIAFAVRDAHHAGKIRPVILAGVVFGFLGLAKVFQAIDEAAMTGSLAVRSRRVFQGRFPVGILLDAVMVGLGKLRTALQRQHRLREQHHRMGFLGHRADHLEDMIGNNCPAGPFLFHFFGLGPGGDFARHQQVIQSAHIGHLGPAWLGQLGQHLGDGHAAELDAGGRVDEGNVRHHGS